MTGGPAGPVLGHLDIECGGTDVADPFRCRPGVVPAPGGVAWAGWGVAVLTMVTAAAVAARRSRPSTPWVGASRTATPAVVAGGR